MMVGGLWGGGLGGKGVAYRQLWEVALCGGCGCNAAGRAGESQQLDGAGGECQRKMRVFALGIQIEVRAKYSEHGTLINSSPHSTQYHANAN